MKRELEIPHDIEIILLNIADAMRVPSDMSIVERLEISIDALANSYDSSVPTAADSLKEHKPLDMTAAVHSALNVDISVPYEHTQAQGRLI